MNAGRLSLSRRPRPLAAPHGLIGLRGWLALLGTVAAVAGGYMWLRESSLAEVRDVSITGFSANESPQIRKALTAAARDMTTLHVRMDALRSAVAPFSIVKDVKAEGDFPHTLRIEVVEHKPVAILSVDGRLLPVAGDGTLLRGELASRKLPKVAVSVPPGGSRLAARAPLAAVTALAAAPASLVPSIIRARRGPDGLRIELSNGPQLIFGTAGRTRAKWAAAARVLADPSAKGATYIDVRIPERAVAGRFPTSSSATAAAQTAPPAVPAGAPAQ